jgi:ATP sulfurylase
MKVEVSIGEVVDKTTILEIKKEKFKSEDKLKNVIKEYEILKAQIEKVGITIDSDEYKRLKEINLKLWHIEDDLRIMESKKEFNQDFIELARSVYFTNDKRAEVKKEINLNHGSDLVEEKEYVEYQ